MWSEAMVKRNGVFFGCGEMWVHKSMPCTLASSQRNETFDMGFAGEAWPHFVDAFRSFGIDLKPRITKMAFFLDGEKCGFTEHVLYSC